MPRRRPNQQWYWEQLIEDCRAIIDALMQGPANSKSDLFKRVGRSARPMNRGTFWNRLGFLVQKGVINTEETNRRDDKVSLDENWRIAFQRLQGYAAIALPRERGEAIEPSRKHIAVLPLESIIKDKECEYFSAGLTEELISALSNISGFVVPPRSSVIRFMKPRTNLTDICAKLKVSHLLEGSVRHGNDRVKITMRLIDAGNRVLWSEIYSMRLEDIIDVQTEISQKVAEALEGKLTPEEEFRIARRWASNSAAYLAYLNGRSAMMSRTTPGLRRAMKFFEKSIEADPKYALAFSGLADCYTLAGGDGGFLEPGLARQKAKEMAAEAIRLNDSLAEAHASLAYLLENEWDWKGAEREFRRAIMLNQSYAQAHHWFAAYLSLMGRSGEAISEIRQAQELDPLSLMVNSAAGMVYIYAGNYDEAIKQLNEALETEPDFVPATWNLASAYLLKSSKSHEDAVRLAEKADRLANHKGFYRSALGYTYAVVGRKFEARQILDELIEKKAPAFFVAMIYAGLGEGDNAMDGLMKAYSEHSDYLLVLKASPIWKSLRRHPRFVELLTKLGIVS